MYASSSLDIQYRPDLHILTVRWQEELTFEQLQAEYGVVLEEARRYQATRWLIDVRRRPTPSPDMASWVSEVWLSQVEALELSRSPRLAFLISPTREQALRQNSALIASVQAAYLPERNYYLATFGDEGEATRWLQAE